MSPNDIDLANEPLDDPEAAMRDARQRFVAAFPKRADSMGFLLNLVATLGPRGPVRPLVEIVHRTAGLAGTLGFPTVSKLARDLEELLEGADRTVIDAQQANVLFDTLRDAFTEDLANPPVWATAVPGTGQARRILVVEDDEDQREVLAIQLRAAGFSVIQVAEGDKVVDAARQARPDLILLDANLPGLDGYSVCRLLKADPDLAGTPVVFTTVRAKADDKAVGLLLGADEYLTKPLDFAELVLRVSLLLERRAARLAATKAPAVGPGQAAATPACPTPEADGADLDYESFVTVAREHLSHSPAVLALVRVPEPRLIETYNALRAELRRRDLVACYDSAHLVLLMGGMPPAKASDRLSDIIGALSPGRPLRFHAGLAHTPAAGAKTFERLLGEADEAIAAARHRGVIVALSGEPADGSVRARGTVVIADDDPEVTRLIDTQLRAAGYTTVLAQDGASAIEAVETGRPDLVIVDMMMPRMTGIDVLARLRNMPERPPTIVLSARGREQDITRAFALGADDYVTKPFSPQELLARIERLLR
jgi:DNA-binding response OmpR family regulator